MGLITEKQAETLRNYIKGHEKLVETHFLMKRSFRELCLLIIEVSEDNNSTFGLSKLLSTANAHIKRGI
jgi:hypothetical protein